MPYQPAQSVLAEVDVSDPARLRLVRTLTLDGSYVAARLVGSVARIVAAAQVPSALPFKQPTSGTPEAIAAADRQNARRRRVARRSASWLPVLPDQARRREGRARRARSSSAATCAARRRSPASACSPCSPSTSRKGLAAGRLGRGDDGRPDRLRLAREPLRRDRALGRPARRRTSRRSRAGRRPDRDPQVRHLEPGADAVPRQRHRSPATCSASGRSRSTRASSASSAPRARRGGARAARRESFLTTLRQPGGALVQAGRIGGLGKGERVYAVRFVGDTGYVVTFRQIDPLYTLDLADARAAARARRAEDPRLLGLPAPGRRGPAARVGQDATEEGRPLGTQLSLFDVSEPAQADAAAHAASRPGLVGGGVRPPRLPLLAARRGSSSIPFEQRAVGYRVGRTRGIDAARQDRARAGRPIRPGSAARSSSATACSRSRTRASRRAAWRRWPSAAGRPSRRPRSRKTRIRKGDAAMPEFTVVLPRNALLGRRHEPRARRARSSSTPASSAGRPTRIPRARSGRVHDVQAGGQERRRREPAAAGGDAVPLDDVHRERRRRRDRRRRSATRAAPC